MHRCFLLLLVTWPRFCHKTTLCTKVRCCVKNAYAPFFVHIRRGCFRCDIQRIIFSTPRVSYKNLLHHTLVPVCGQFYHCFTQCQYFSDKLYGLGVPEQCPEMIGASSVSYLARTPCVPLFSILFNTGGNRSWPVFTRPFFLFAPFAGHPSSFPFSAYFRHFFALEKCSVQCSVEQRAQCRAWRGAVPGWISPQSSGRKFLPEICMKKGQEELWYYQGRVGIISIVRRDLRPVIFGVNKSLLVSPFLEPLSRALFRTLPPSKAHSKTPSKNPSPSRRRSREPFWTLIESSLENPSKNPSQKACCRTTPSMCTLESPFWGSGPEGPGRLCAGRGRS